MTRIFPFILWALLGGCTLLPVNTAPVPRPAQAESVPFALNGRISVSHQEQRHSAGLRWTHHAQSDEVLLLAPLGQTAARIWRDAAGATLEEGGRLHQAADAEALMQQVLGWQLPLAGLHHWVLGMPKTESPAQIERDGNGRIVLLRQDGWEVRYLRHAGEGADSLPSRMQLVRDDLQVQLLIDEWDWQP